MSFFSSDAFLEVVGDVFHPGTPRTFAPVQVGGEAFRLLVLKNRKIVSRAPFWDYVEPLPPGGPQPSHRLSHLPHAVRNAVAVETWEAHASESVYTPAPYLDWARFDSWEAFLAHAGTRSPFAFKLSERKRKKIARELGPVTLLDSGDAAMLADGMRWKSAQYRRTGLWDVFAVERNRQLFTELFRRGHLDLRALAAGGRVIAMHAGVVHEGRYYYWMPAHDPDTASYSPGTLLLEHLLELAYQNRWQFDFLIGGEPYKLAYATHVRLVGLAGLEPIKQRAYQALRRTMVAQVRRSPQVYRLLQASKRHLKQRALM